MVDLEVLPGLPGIGSTNSAAQDATTASEGTDLVGPAPSEPYPGGGGDPDPNPNPCSNPQLECPIGPLESSATL